jgi:hypothetical protein
LDQSTAFAREYSCISAVVWSLLNVAAKASAAAVTSPEVAGADDDEDDDADDDADGDEDGDEDVESSLDPQPASSRRTAADAVAGRPARRNLEPR